MSMRIIVSYDDTDNDQDALALGDLLAQGGATLALAYVRHAQQADSEREALEEREAEQLLAHGAGLLSRPDVARHVIVHASTADGLRELMLREQTDLVVFGSDYRTASGAVVPGTSAERLMHGGPTAVAIAPADLRSQPALNVERIGVLDEGDGAAKETASSLAGLLGATVVDSEDGEFDLLVVGSTEGVQAGRVTLSASTEYEIQTAKTPVLAVPRSTPLPFSASAPAVAGV
jgi:nucleotide-binding universal stress UspA family protein